MNEEDLNPYINSVNNNWDIIDKEMAEHKKQIALINKRYGRLGTLLLVLLVLQVTTLIVGFLP